MGRWPTAVPAAAIAVCALVALAVLAGPAGLLADDGEQATSIEPAALDAQDGEFDRSVITVELAEDGDAVWTFRYERTISDEDEREGFENFAEEFEVEETELWLNFLNRAETVTDAGENATDREMSVEDPSRSASIEQDVTQEVGVVEMSFRWTSFAATDEDETVRAGDVFEGGLFLSDRQSFVYEAADLRFQSVGPEESATPSGGTLEESGTVTWTGEQVFTDRHPRAVLEPYDPDEGTGDGGDDGEAADGDNGGAADGGTGDDADPTESSDAVPLSSPWVVGGGLLVVVAIAIAVAALRREGLEPTDPEAAPDPDPAPEAPATDPDPDEGAVEDEDLLSDEERVVQLLEEREGRMRQSGIVDETEWSKSKVSMLLSEMEDEGTISKIQVGRENIIALEGHEPDAVGSPFDDE